MHNAGHRRNTNKHQRNSNFTMKSLALWAVRLGVAICYIWLLMWAAFGDGLPNLGYINAGAILIGTGAGLSAILLLFWRSYIWAALGFLFFCLIFAMGSGFNFSASSDSKAGDLRIVSASLRGLNKDMVSAARRLAEYDGDIIALQEVTDLPKFLDEFNKITGVKWYNVKERNYVILSKYPSSLAENRSKYWNSAKIQTPKGPITVWNIHAAKSFGRPAENRTYYVNLLDQLNIYEPDFLVGDFNATPWNYGYRLIDKKMRNAHQVAGFGPGMTFPAPGRSVGILGAFSRIDHIFVKAEYQLINAFTGEASAGSDHHPVIADIIL